MTYRLAVDSGGTFTDGVLMDRNGEVTTTKAHSTPENPSIGTMNCITKLASEKGISLKRLLNETGTIILGTTIATNLVATRTGAKMGTIATQGYRLRMTFQQVAKSDWGDKAIDLFDMRLDAPRALTPNYLMTEVEERVNVKGEVLVPLNKDSVRKAVRYLKEQEVESIAVMLMFSPLYPEHEQKIAEIIHEEYPGVYVALSSVILPVIGEGERWGTTMFSAYLAPTVTRYVAGIKDILTKEGFKGELGFIQSNGGIATPEIIVENPATLLLSGPAAGPSLGKALGQTHGASNVLSVDMGGTSFDVGVVHEGNVDVVQLKVVDAKKFALPAVDVNAAGAGGGSIAWIDNSGRLQVGPKSAGAFPGPACYGQGGQEPTVTDADVILGYIDPDYFLHGETKLRKDLAEKAIKGKIADPLGLTVPEAAAAIYDVINAVMASATDVTFAKRGYDPREFSLCAAGGAAPVHAVPIMQELGIKKLIIPKVSPTYCAFGMMFCDLKHDYTRPYPSVTDKADLARINELYDEMEAMAVDTLKREGMDRKDMIIEKSMEIRYYGQFRQRLAKVPSGPVTAESLKATIEDFHTVHKSALGYCDTHYPTEIIRLHLTGRAKPPQPKLRPVAKGSGNVSSAVKGERKAYFPGEGFIPAKVFDGDKLLAENTVEGPCIIEEKFTTVVVPPGIKGVVDTYGNYLFTDEGKGPRKQPKRKAGNTIDPTTFAVIWNKFDYLAEQMGQKILYATQSFVTANARDLGQTMLSKDGKIVVAASYLPIHTMVAEEAIRGLESYFHGDYEPGDYIVANDPYIVKGGHLPDWNFIRPIFYKGEHIGFFQAKTHVTDTGGFLPGGYGPGAYDIIAEGLNIPPIKVLKKGVLQKELWNFLLRNIRNPTEVDMDTNLINGAMIQAEEQVAILCDKYGVETVKTCMKEIVAAGEGSMRAEIAKIPDGTYYGESSTDWDGKTDKQIFVRCKATVKGEEIIFDLSGSDPQATFVNVPLGLTRTNVLNGFYSLIDKSVPKNGGTFNPITVIAPEGTVVNPVYPATVGASQIAVGIQIQEAAMYALDLAMPEKAMAGWSKHICPIQIGMDPGIIDPRTGHIRQYFSETFASDGGSGALKGYDGWQGVAILGSGGNFARPNIEFYESTCPYLVTRYEVLQDCEGAGEFRGGPGTLVELVAHVAEGAPSYIMTGNSDGTKYTVPGVTGGQDAPKAEMWIEAVDGTRRELRTMVTVPIFPGEKVVTRAPGGGGWGNPLDRDVRKVQNDVVDGLVSIERAKNVYGVVLDPGTFEIKYQATQDLRKALKEKQAGETT
jgi:N-methylhydantoinase A/oxoprolinase/acetone carboxylase beta subunit/N-methylhydantoinase B/oxoprolinase/acetone carboxylase alpha subunit